MASGLSVLHVIALEKADFILLHLQSKALYSLFLNQNNLNAFIFSQIRQTAGMNAIHNFPFHSYRQEY
jgi:hypothetical protein